MNTSIKTAIVFLSAFATFVTVFHLSMQRQIVEGFPMLDPKLAKKAYTVMVRRALAGKMTHVDFTNDDQITTAFLEIYWELNPS